MIARIPFQRAGEPWELRTAEVKQPPETMVAIGEDLRAHGIQTGAPPSKLVEPDPDADPRPDELTRLVAMEGGSVHLIGERDVYRRKWTAAELGEGDPPRTLLRFASGADREAYIRDRGWLDLGRRGSPTVFSLLLQGGLRDIRVHFLRGAGELVFGGEEFRSRPNREQWKQFFATVAEFDVWSWSRWYRPFHFALDHEHWRLLLAHEGRLLASHGYGAKPPTGDPGSDAFEDFVSLTVGLFGEDASAALVELDARR